MADSDGNKSMVEILHPEVWSLAVRLSPDKLTYAISSRMDENSLIFGHVDFAGSASKPIGDLESAIYDNEFFLYNYERTDFIVEAPHFLLVPDEFSKEGDADECEKYYRYLYPDDKVAIRTDSIKDAAITVAYGIEPEVDAFLRRTFDNPPVMHLLTPMIRYFRKKGSFGTGGKMFAFINDGKVEIVALRNSKVIFANYFKFAATEDAFYYIMNAWKANGMSSETDELHLLGEKEVRKQLIAQIREYVSNTIQTIFPAQLLHLGKDAMIAPFDLIVLPLCE